ncbi:MAG: trehalose-phosphatase [Syntrophales bacterium]|jgi:alpha,alpha-trehalase|nr:trehalose-phosphatase [Syntrophales bacterium]MDY0045006.1 trehalose-phosphatase [Syntrophales bacterium]
MNKRKPAVTLSRSKYDAVIFDMDGVMTRTAKVHAAAWKDLFDEFRERSGGTWSPFDPGADYRRYVDGKPRLDGIESFLASRNIELPYGTPGDDPDEKTVYGLGNRKNRFFHALLEQQGVERFEPGVRLVKDLNEAGFKTAVISASKNCVAVLEAAEILHLFQAKVDGVDSQELGLKGKPDPDIFIEAARRLGVEPARSVVVEDAIAGVQAGRAGYFGCVIGVDRTGHGAELKENGADIVVTQLSDVIIEEPFEPPPPSALDSMEKIASALKGKEAALFLDYDGTLTPIVDTPGQAVLSKAMKERVVKLAALCKVAVISGRDLEDVRDLVGIDTIFYAGSHGFDIAGPAGRKREFQQGREFLPVLDEAEGMLKENLSDIAGALVERKKFSIAVHYRKVKDEQVERVTKIVDEVLERFPQLRNSRGKKVYDLQPRINWHKGKALLWVLDALDLDRPGVLPFYIGDDVTDEDAFRALRDRGIGIAVMERAKPTDALYILRDTGEVGEFLEALGTLIKG